MIFANVCSGQSNSEQIQESYDYGMALLKHNAPYDALRVFKSITQRNPNLKFPKDIQYKIDSLQVKADSLIIAQKHERKLSLRGTWLLNGTVGEDGTIEINDSKSYLKVTTEEFILYEKDCSNKIVNEKREPIIYCTKHAMNSSVFDFVFSDNSIWSIVANSDKLIRIETGNLSDQGRSIISCGMGGYQYVKVE
jgi:hypothetical protein